MTLILKVIDDQGQFAIYGDVASIVFRHVDDGTIAHLHCREPVKTAHVPGFCEVEKQVAIADTQTAYVMNENGRTISTWRRGDTGGPI